MGVGTDVSMLLACQNLKVSMVMHVGLPDGVTPNTVGTMQEFCKKSGSIFSQMNTAMLNQYMDHSYNPMNFAPVYQIKTAKNTLEVISILALVTQADH